jgi:hypothetical protein
MSFAPRMVVTLERTLLERRQATSATVLWPRAPSEGGKGGKKEDDDEEGDRFTI